MAENSQNAHRRVSVSHWCHKFERSLERASPKMNHNELHRVSECVSESEGTIFFILTFKLGRKSHSIFFVWHRMLIMLSLWWHGGASRSDENVFLNKALKVNSHVLFLLTHTHSLSLHLSLLFSLPLVFIINSPCRWH